MAQAKVGDSLAQLCQRFGAYTIVSEGIYEFNVSSSQTIVSFVMNNTSVDELYIFYRPLNSDGEPPKEIVRFVLDSTSRNDKWHEVKPPFGTDYALQNKNDGLTALLRYKGHASSWSVEIGYTPTIVALNSEPVRPRATPAPQVQTEPRSEDGRTPADCAIIAAQAYAKLKPVTSWCQIVGIRWSQNGQPRMSHAVVMYKYQSDGHVFVYDESGTLELDTTSEDLDALQMVLQDRYQPKFGVIIASLKYLTH
jgi:hypothetical protein